MLVFLQGIGGAEQENGGKQVPLDFQQAIGAVVENETHAGVAGADDGHGQHQPERAFADTLIKRVDELRELEQKGHELFSSVDRMPDFWSGRG